MTAPPVVKAHAVPVTWQFLFAHPAHFVACGLGSGLSPWAPGTVGTLFAWLNYALLRVVYVNDVNFGIFLLLMGALGVWCCHVAGQHLGDADHGGIVWDEMLAFWLVLWIAPSGILWQVAAFAFFRLYDIVKPAPASWFDRHCKHGWGVMMDDVVAAGYALFSLAVIKSVVEGFFSRG